MSYYLSVLNKYWELFKNESETLKNSETNLFLESFLNGLLSKIELFTNYIIENEFYLNDKSGILFCISHELSLFDEIYQKNDLNQPKKYIQILGPAIEWWAQKM